jgi:Zn-dependent peptidase ImmA (M78 family)/transcriptional regulator with XRE-family HTH domain
MGANDRGARLGDLRRLHSLTQSQLADLSGVSQPNLSNIENGRAGLSDAVAIRVAQATGTPVEFFDFPSLDYDSTAIHFRRSKQVSARGREFVLQAFKEIERIAHHLAGASPVRLRQLKLPVAEQADIVTDRDIESISADARAASGVPDDGPIRNVIRTAERAGIAVAPLSAGGENEALLRGHCGMSRWSRRAERATVAYGAGMPGDRLRFTIAHELGHVLLHTHRQVDDEKQREREADLFAGAFLIPKSVADESISETLTLHGYMRLKAKFGVAIQALIMRGRTTGLISQQRHRSLMIQMASRGWRTNEPVRVKVETPMLLWTQMAAIYGDSPYFQASQELGVPVSYLRQWIPERQSRTSAMHAITEATMQAVIGARDVPADQGVVVELRRKD